MLRGGILVLISIVAGATAVGAEGPTAVGTENTAPPPSLWKPEWRRASVPELIGFAALEGVALTGPLVLSAPAAPRWHGGIFFDYGVRDALLLGHSGQKTASTISDVGLYILEAAPIFDAGLAAWWYRGDRDTALQLTIMYAEAYALTSTIQWGLRAAFARERPVDHFNNCSAPDPMKPTNPECAGSKDTSFPSNHAAFAFTSAALLCTEHANIALYGNINDHFICAEALTLAAGISIARVMKDRHWSTDILAGAVIGSLSGWSVPRFLHFRRPSSKKTDHPNSALMVIPIANPGPLSLSVLGLM